MKKGIKTIGVLLLLLIIAGGAYYYFNPKKALNIIIPQINQVENIRVRLLQDTAMIDIALKMQNKSFFKLHIDSLMYHIKFDTATLLSRSEFINVELLRSQVDTIQLPLALPYKRLMRKIKSLQGQDSVDIKIDLRIVYATVFGKTVLPYSKTIRIEVPRPPKFEVEKVEYVSRHKKTVYLLAHVKMHNYGKIDLNISDINYHIVVKELFTAKGTEKREIHIKPHSDISVEFPIKVEFKNILKTVGLIIRNDDKVKYHLTATALIQNDKVGSKKTPLEVEKDGYMELKK